MSFEAVLEVLDAIAPKERHKVGRSERGLRKRRN